MGRRHSIVARKTAGDKAKGKTYSMMSKVIQLAAKKGADPKMNPSLDLALQKARYHGVPRDIVERAILKGSGQLEGETLEEIFYEGYGPGGVGVLIKTLTGNTNRTSGSVKVLFNKYGGTMTQPNAVARQFKETGVIITDGKIEKQTIKGKEIENILPLKQEELEEQVLEMPIEDIEIDDKGAVLYTSKQDFAEVSKSLENQNYHIVEADIQFLPENTIALDNLQQEQFFQLIDALENDEDIDKVRYNLKQE